MGRYREDSDGGVFGSSIPCGACVSAHPLSGDHSAPDLFMKSLIIRNDEVE